MIFGILFALGACFLWGLVFIVPQFLDDFSAIELALGRYFVYGSLSTAIIINKGLAYWKKIPSTAWVTALSFGLISNILYYMGVVFGLRYATAPITILIIGLTPITVAFYGNWQTREIPFRSLMIPCLWMFFGMVLVNITEVDWTFSTYTPAEYLYGLGWACVALFGWTWFAVNNARFLKQYPSFRRSDWTTLLGFCTLGWVIIFGVVYYMVTKSTLDLSKLSLFTSSGLRYLGGVLLLGIVCSWLGSYLWNYASTYLPMPLMGGLIICETLFGLSFVYVCDFHCPSWMEFVGIFSMVGGIISSIIIVHKGLFRKVP